MPGLPWWMPVPRGTLIASAVGVAVMAVAMFGWHVFSARSSASGQSTKPAGAAAIMAMRGATVAGIAKLARPSASTPH